MDRRCRSGRTFAAPPRNRRDRIRRFCSNSGSTATSSRPPCSPGFGRYATAGTFSTGADSFPSAKMRSRPGFSVMSRRPSGRNAIPHGNSSAASCSIRTLFVGLSVTSPGRVCTTASNGNVAAIAAARIPACMRVSPRSGECKSAPPARQSPESQQTATRRFTIDTARPSDPHCQGDDEAAMAARIRSTA